MIKDRGNIKWTALLLSEHRDALRELKEEDKDRKKPELDEQEIERISWVIQEAMRESRPVKVKYYKDKRFYDVEGMVERIESEAVVVGGSIILVVDLVYVRIG